MEREEAHGALSPALENGQASSAPALVVHVDIHFTDPVLRSRYSRTYASSAEFDATTKVCRGLVRRIERATEEFITRKDSTALELFRRDSFDRKPQRFEITFRILRRGTGEFAERTYRSYQRQPLTAAQTRDVVMAAHRIIGLYLLRHDRNFRWTDSPAADAAETEAPEISVSSRDGPPSLSSVPVARFFEATQTFEFVPGYDIILTFRSTNRQRQVLTFEKTLKVKSNQSAPLTLSVSEDLLRRAQKAVNDELDLRRQQLGENASTSNDNALGIGLKIVNNLGRLYDQMRADMTSALPLFRDPEAKDCEAFLSAVEKRLENARNAADSTVMALNDLDIRVVELKGVDWTLRDPVHFTIGPEKPYGRQTIQAALDRLQTGIGDVIRGHNVAIHIRAVKRGHLILDKAIVAHEKRGKPRETFRSLEDEQAVFVSRLKARIKTDMDRVFEDSCSIDDLPDEEEPPVRPVTPVNPVQRDQPIVNGTPRIEYSPASASTSARSSISKVTIPTDVTRPTTSAGPQLLQPVPKSRARRVFSLSRRSIESVKSIENLRLGRHHSVADSESRPSTPNNEQASQDTNTGSSKRHKKLFSRSENGHKRALSLGSKRLTSWLRLGSSSNLQSVPGTEGTAPVRKDGEVSHQFSGASQDGRPMTSIGGEATPRPPSSSGSTLESASLVSFEMHSSTQKRELPTRSSTAASTTPVAGQPKPGALETPEFVDSREYASSSPALQEAAAGAKAELSTGVPRVLSPRDDDEYSTPPSTPELSVGASSGGHSIVITPVLQRSSAVAKDNMLTRLYPDSEPEEEPEAISGSPHPKLADAGVSNDRLATPSLPSGDRDQRSRNPSPQPLPTPPSEGDAATGSWPPTPDPAARAPLHETAESRASSHATTPSNSSMAGLAAHESHDANNSGDNSPVLQGTANEDTLSEALGAESATTGTEVDVPCVIGTLPDFPTQQVRTPSPLADGADGTRDTHETDACDISVQSRNTIAADNDASSLSRSRVSLVGDNVGADSAAVRTLQDGLVAETAASETEKVDAAPRAEDEECLTGEDGADRMQPDAFVQDIGSEKATGGLGGVALTAGTEKPECGNAIGEPVIEVGPVEIAKDLGCGADPNIVVPETIAELTSAKDGLREAGLDSASGPAAGTEDLSDFFKGQKIGTVLEPVGPALKDGRPGAEDVVVGGAEISPGEEVLTVNAEDHRNESQAPGPERDSDSEPVGQTEPSPSAEPIGPIPVSESGPRSSAEDLDRKIRESEGSDVAPAGLGIVEPAVREIDGAGIGGNVGLDATGKVPEANEVVVKNVGTDAVEPGELGKNRGDGIPILNLVGNAEDSAGGSTRAGLSPTIGHQETSGQAPIAATGSWAADIGPQTSAPEAKNNPFDLQPGPTWDSGSLGVHFPRLRRHSTGDLRVDNKVFESDDESDENTPTNGDNAAVNGASEDVFGPENGLVRTTTGSNYSHKTQASLTSLEQTASETETNDLTPTTTREEQPPSDPTVPPRREPQGPLPRLAPVSEIAKFANRPRLRPRPLHSFNRYRSRRGSIDSNIHGPKRPPPSAAEPSSSTGATSRPQTAGYIGLGLGQRLTGLAPKGVAGQGPSIGLRGSTAAAAAAVVDEEDARLRVSKLLRTSPKVPGQEEILLPRPRRTRPPLRFSGDDSKFRVASGLRVVTKPPPPSPPSPPEEGADGSGTPVGAEKKKKEEKVKQEKGKDAQHQQQHQQHHDEDDRHSTSGNSASGEEPKVLPRMMVLLAGAVAIGKMVGST
ncbi:hypothetical protein VTJ04DRAFT_999 [Mycothermus thermophilus]|uniref:uncharacterized protein n=1 Tax=Humicola insolens TaxID=85995 RepID=UPI003744A943